MWQFAQYFHRFNRKAFYGILGLALLSSISEGLGIALLIPILSHIGVGSPLDLYLSNVWFGSFIESLDDSLKLAVYLFGALILIGLRSLLIWYHDRRNMELQYAFHNNLRNNLFSKLTQASWGFHVNSKSATHNRILSADIERIAEGSQALIAFFDALLMSLVYLLIAFYLAPGFALFSLLLLLLMSVLLKSGYKRSTHLGSDLADAYDAFYTTLEEHWKGLKLAKVFNVQSALIDNFKRDGQQFFTLVTGFLKLQADSRLKMQWVSAAIVCGSVYIGILVFDLHALELILLVVIASRLMPRAGQFIKSYLNIGHILPVWNNYVSLLQRLTEHQEPSAIRSLNLTGAPQISLRHVSFKHPSSTFRLSNVSLELKAGSVNLLYGVSGIGKTTLGNLLLGLLVPEEGHLCINGVPLEASQVLAWRSYTAIVPQEDSFQHKTIAENLRFTNKTASNSQLIAVLDAVAIGDLVRRLPAGLESTIGDQGCRLSAGERQRLSIARALIARPKFLVLDEPSSALDDDNSRRIFEIIEQLQGQLTILVISHDYRAKSYADQVLYLGDTGLVTHTVKLNERDA